MSIFSSRRHKKQKKQNIFDEKNDERKQFNVRIDESIILEIQEMAQKLRVNQSVLFEHLAQTALFYTNIAMKDEEKKNILEKHLINVHLLDKNVGDEGAMLIIGEENSNWLLLGQSKLLVSRMKRIRKAMDYALGTNNLDLYEKEERNLRREILKYTEWIFRLSAEDS
ncbi:hypothetical protein ACFLTO_05190 [Chloroflexota bacterium]